MLNDVLVRRLIEDTRPSFQATDLETLNLGPGWLYYGFVRAIRPRRILSIGSKRGFSPLCLALGNLHNEGNTVINVSCYATDLSERANYPITFVDPSKSVDRGESDHSYGEGFWDDEAQTSAWFESFGCSVIPRKCDSDSFFASTSDVFDLILLDGSHTYDQVSRDLVAASDHLTPGGLILIHDVHPDVQLIDASFGSHRAFADFSHPNISKVLLPIFPGLGMAFDQRLPARSSS